MTLAKAPPALSPTPVRSAGLGAEIGSLEALGRLLEKLGRVRGVISVQRHAE